MNRNYLKYLFKSKKGLTVAILITFLLIYFTSYLTFKSEDIGSFIALYITVGVCGLLCFVLPPILLAYVHNKKAVDSYFSIPVSRKEMIISTEFYMNVIVQLPMILLSVITFVNCFINNPEINIEYCLIFVLVGIISIFTLLLFNSALVLVANNNFDAVVIELAYALLPLFLIIAIDCVQETYVIGYVPFASESLSKYISLVSTIFVMFVNCSSSIFESDSLSYIPFVICVLWHLIVSFMSIHKNYVERKMERADTITNRFFSYPFLSFIYAFLLVFITTISFDFESYFSIVFLYSLIFIAFITSRFIYRRKIRITLKDVVIFIVTIALSFAFAFVSYSTKGFGLSSAYNHNPESIRYRYSTYIVDGPSYPTISKAIDKVYGKADFEIHLTIDLKKDEYDQYKELIDLFEVQRDKCINDRYSSMRNLYKSSEALLYIDENIDNIKDRIDYRYGLLKAIDENTLLQINKYADICLEIYTNNAYYECTLNELFSEAK